MRRIVIGVRLQEVELQERVVPPGGEAQPGAADRHQASVPVDEISGVPHPGGEHVEGHRAFHQARRVELADDPVGLVQEIPGVDRRRQVGARAVWSIACDHRLDDPFEEPCLALAVGQPLSVTADAGAGGVGGAKCQGVIEEHRHHLEAGGRRQAQCRIQVVEGPGVEPVGPTRGVHAQPAAPVGEHEPAHDPDAVRRHRRAVVRNLSGRGADPRVAAPDGGAEVAAVVPPGVVDADDHAAARR